jgi:hypothetical protein
MYSLYFERRVKFWWGNLRVREKLGDPGVDERIIIRLISGSGMWRYGLYRAGSG